MTMKSLRERLRDADPVALEPPLDAAGIERMRRHVLVAGNGRPRKARLRWAARCAGLAVVIAVAAIVVGPRDAGRGTVDADRRSDRVDAPDGPLSVAAAAPVAEPEAPVVAPVVPPVVPRVAPPASLAIVPPVTVIAAAPTAVPATAGARLRLLHFTAPGGTRLIWLFDSDVNAEVTP